MSPFHFSSLDRASVFHPGEQLVQQKTGVREQIRTSGMEDFVRPTMPSQHRAFFAQQPLMYLGSRDPQGRPWATVVAGRPGFVSSSDPQHLQIKPLQLHPKDPLSNSLHPGAHVGMLGIELHTRRRNRLNGVVARSAAAAPAPAGPGGGGAALDIDVSLSFGNCPKYIQGRQLVVDWDAWDRARAGAGACDAGGGGVEAVVVGGRTLGAAQRRIVRRADTFFISSCYDGPVPAHVQAASVGCDMSHRGGPPGFIKLQQQQQQQDKASTAGGQQQEQEGSVLRWADYAGNNMFQTLGNLMTEPKAGILIVDFETGDTLQLTGEARVDFEDRSLPGAQRTVSFAVHSFVHIREALPLRQVGAVDWSPFLPHADEEDEEEEEEQEEAGEQGARERGRGQQPQQPSSQLLECVSAVPESHDITTFEFKLPAGVDPAAAYLPGQYATFEFPASALQDGAASGPPVVRTWTVSSHPSWSAASSSFTISVKRAGAVSGLLHRTMRAGVSAAFRGFGGDFVPRLPPPLPPAASGQLPGAGPVLLLAGGIGITPLRAMLHDLVLRADASDGLDGPDAPLPASDVVLLYSVRRLEDAAFMDELSALALTSRPRGVRVRLLLAASQAEEGEVAAAAARWPAADVHRGRLSPALLQRYATAGEEGANADVNAGTALSTVRCAFMCGPPGFMSSMEAALRAGGMDMSRLFTESFAF